MRSLHLESKTSRVKFVRNIITREEQSETVKETNVSEQHACERTRECPIELAASTTSWRNWRRSYRGWFEPPLDVMVAPIATWLDCPPPPMDGSAYSWPAFYLVSCELTAELDLSIRVRRHRPVDLWWCLCLYACAFVLSNACTHNLANVT